MGGYSSVKHTNTSGLKIIGLAKGDIVNMIHIDGDVWVPHCWAGYTRRSVGHWQ